MRIKYSILWVDDEIDFIKDMEFDRELESYVSGLSFLPSIDIFENVEEAERKLENKKYDLIFSDYNINENKTGKDFIENLRAKNVNCEVLFYSAMQDLPKGGLDRVTYFRLESSSAYEKLIEKMKRVIDLTIEKLNDLANLRGLVISEVCELDDTMDEILKINDLANPDSNVINDLVDKREEGIKNQLQDVTNCRKECQLKNKNCKNTDEILKSFDSALKARGVNQLINLIQYHPTRQNFYEDYLDEIINKRNNLAHCVSTIENDKEILKTRKGDVSFTSEDMRTIRHDIIKYLELFGLLLKKLKNED